MPSKRKKNKRRMRRVQVQRRVLEEKHAANPPGKASNGMAITPSPKKAAKAPAPGKIQQLSAARAAARVEPKRVVKEPAAKSNPAQEHQPAPDDALLRQCAAEVQVHAEVKQEAATQPGPDEDRQSETAALSAEVAAQVLPAFEARTESEICVCVGPPTVLSDLQIQPEDTSVMKMDVEMASAGPVTEAKKKGEDTAAAPTLSVVTDTSPSAAAAVAPSGKEEEILMLVKLQSDRDEPSADNMGIQPAPVNIPEVFEPEQEAETAASNPPTDYREQESEAAEPAASFLVETIVNSEKSQTPSHTSAGESPSPTLEADKTLFDTQHAPNIEHPSAAELAGAPLVSDVAGTESEVAVGVTAAASQEHETTAAPAGSPAVSEPEFEAAVAGAEQTFLEPLPEEPPSESCDVPCQMSVPVEFVQLGAEEVPVDTALNGHVVPEVSIEG